jgi:predicted ATPase
MRISAITIENFKGISDPVRVELKPITLLFGANSVGKSTIVQALHYVREILERNNVDADRCLNADESIDLGGFRNLVHNHDLSRRIRLRVELELYDTYLPEYPALVSKYDDTDFESTYGNRLEVTFTSVNDFVDISSLWVELEVGWSKIVDKPLLISYAVGLNNAPLARISCGDDGRNIRISSLEIRHQSLLHICIINFPREYIEELYLEAINPAITGAGTDINLMLINMNSVLPNWGKELTLAQECFATPSDSKNSNLSMLQFVFYISQFIVGPGELLLNAMKTGRYIGPIRKIPPRGYTPVRYEDESRWSSGLAAWDLLYKAGPALVEETSYWLSKYDRLDSGYSLRMLRFKKLDMESELYKTMLTKGAKGKAAIGNLVEQLPEEQQLLLTDKRGLDVLPQDVGIGISQILPVVVGALDKSTGILMVEQPELHIHPGLQCRLGDLFISQIQAEGKTFIIETHSEHLLLRLLRRIREANDGELPEGIDGLTPEQISVNYVELTEDGLRVRPLHISNTGNSLGEWPKSFFEERAGELF